MHPVFYVPAGDILPIYFSTYAGATGASITLTGLAVTDIEIYKDASMTQRASDAGYTLIDTDGIDIDGTTGIHGFSVDTGDNTDASFYTVGAWFTVVVSAVTVDSQTVNFIAAQFRIMPAETVAAVPKVDISHLLGTAWLTPGTAGTPDVNVKLWNALATVELPLVPTTAGRKLDVSAGGEAGIDWANIGSPTTAQNLSATNIDVDQVVASVSGAVGSVTGAVGSVTGNVGGNVTGSVGSVAAGGIAEASFATTAGSVAPLGIVDQGTAQAATGTTLQLRSAAAFADDELIGATILITGGTTGVGQSRVITDYVGATDTATVDTWTTTPTGTITYKIFATSPSSGSAPTTAQIAEAMFTYNATADYSTADAGSVVKQIADNAGGSALTVEAIADEVQTRTIAAVTTVNGLAANTITAAATAPDFTTEVTSGLATAAELAKVPKSDSNVTWNATALASMQQEATDALNAYDPPTKAEMDTALAAADDAVLAAIAALNNLSAAQVNAEVVDALATDTYAEPGQGTPAATAALSAKIGYIYKAWRNRSTQTASEYALYADDGTTKDQEAACSDDATTFVRGEVGTGA